MKKHSACTILLLFLFLAVPFSFVHAQAATSTASIVTEKAQVSAVLNQSMEQIAGTAVSAPTQSLKVEIVGGPDAGKSIVVTNDKVLLAAGDMLYVQHTLDPTNDVDQWSVLDPYRLPTIALFVGLFIVCAVAFGGKQGLRGLVALALGILVIAYFLLPGILAGFSPILVSMIAAGLIVILGSYITHGFNKVTSAAVIGMVLTILATSGLAWLGVHWGQLTGFSTEESVYLNFATAGRINFAELLEGGILIGLLGILYDAAIGQAAAVDELATVAPHLPRQAIFAKALRIGREHIGALINSLVLAYVGVSLPLLLLFYVSGSAGVLPTANMELFSTEIIRAMIGSIGLILAVPFTTALAVLMLVHPKPEHPGEHVSDLEEKFANHLHPHH